MTVEAEWKAGISAAGAGDVSVHVVCEGMVVSSSGTLAPSLVWAVGGCCCGYQYGQGEAVRLARAQERALSLGKRF